MRLSRLLKIAVCLLALAFAAGRVASTQAQDQDQGQSQSPDQEQAPTGGLRGTISDASSGLGIPDARITVSGGPGGAVDTTADNAGDFIIPKLAEGKYSVVISAPGFKVVARDDVEIAGDMVDLDVTLERDKDSQSAPGAK